MTKIVQVIICPLMDKTIKKKHIPCDCVSRLSLNNAMLIIINGYIFISTMRMNVVENQLIVFGFTTFACTQSFYFSGDVVLDKFHFHSISFSFSLLLSYIYFLLRPQDSDNKTELKKKIDKYNVEKSFIRHKRILTIKTDKTNNKKKNEIIFAVTATTVVASFKT